MNTAVAIGCTERIENSLHPMVGISLWPKVLLIHMVLVKCKAGAKVKITVQNFEEVIAQFRVEIKQLVK